MPGVTVIELKENFCSDDTRIILCKETPIPDLVPGYSEGPLYEFFFVDLRKPETLPLTKETVRVLYKHIRYRRDRIFVWHYLKGFPEDKNPPDES